MADELEIIANMAFTKATKKPSFDPGLIQVDVTGTDYVRKTQSVGFAADEALDVGEIGTAGFLLIRNNDATNYVTLRPGTGENDLVKLLAGEIALFRLATSAPYIIADTAAVEVEYLLIEA